MAINYDEAIAELRAEEKRLDDELGQVRAAIPAMIVLRNRYRASQPTPPLPKNYIQARPLTEVLANEVAGPVGRFLGMGATKAIPILLKDVDVPLTTSEIYDRLKAEGWASTAQSPIGTLSATLGQLKDVVEKIGEGWRLIKPADQSSSTSGWTQPSLQ